MSLVLIFDLDDTLYSEHTFVESGLRAVADFGQNEFGWNSSDSFVHMMQTLAQEGRGRIFDLWLEQKGCNRKTLIKRCVDVYRHHVPSLSLFESAKNLLSLLSDSALYVVTDGHKVTQQKKVEALNIQNYFQHIYITHRYGIKNEKPSPYCFELIRKREGCEWADMLYVGDNPSKDFVSLNKLGAHTVRVSTGAHRNVQARPGYDAQHTIADLTHFYKLLGEIKHGHENY